MSQRDTATYFWGVNLYANWWYQYAHGDAGIISTVDNTNIKQQKESILEKKKKKSGYILKAVWKSCSKTQGGSITIPSTETSSPKAYRHFGEPRVSLLWFGQMWDYKMSW